MRLVLPRSFVVGKRETHATSFAPCRYQSTLPLFLPPSDSPASSGTLDTARETMRAALPVANSSASSASSSASPSSAERRARVALSLGPYGSSLQPGQEYTGAYPPPFGPASTAAPGARPGCSSVALEACPLPLDLVGGEGQATTEAERHLAAWHLQRLQHLAADAGQVDVVAFETVPSLTEVRAIRRAMHAFTASSTSWKKPLPFYISFVFPRTSDQDAAVRFPDPALAHLATLAEQAPVLVRAALDTASIEQGYARPGGIGFNCTSPLHARRVVDLLSREVVALRESERADEDASSRPSLLGYPDGGAVYDVVSRSWHHPTGLTDASWATLVADAVAEAVPTGKGQEDTWAGVVVGGCCKAGPGAIKALRQEVERRGWR